MQRCGKKSGPEVMGLELIGNNSDLMSQDFVMDSVKKEDMTKG